MSNQRSHRKIDVITIISRSRPFPFAGSLVLNLCLDLQPDPRVVHPQGVRFEQDCVATEASSMAVLLPSANACDEGFETVAGKSEAFVFNSGFSAKSLRR